MMILLLESKISLKFIAYLWSLLLIRNIELRCKVILLAFEYDNLVCYEVRIPSLLLYIGYGISIDFLHNWIDINKLRSFSLPDDFRFQKSNDSLSFAKTTNLGVELASITAPNYPSNWIQRI